MSGEKSKVACVLGAQWGDEGKGKLVDLLAQKYDVVARFNGGANAGHTLVVDGKKYAFHLVPCGILIPGCMNVVGNGTVVHTPTMLKELEALDANKIDYKGRLLISKRAHVLFDFHKMVDGAQEDRRGKKSIGTTKRGIGPCYATKMNRNGIRFAELLNFDRFKERYMDLVKAMQRQYPNTLADYDVEAELKNYQTNYIPRIKEMIIDTIVYLNRAIKDGKRVLAEGANAAMLDIDFGTYPAVTSSNTTIGGIATGLGIANKLEACVGVVKAYTTRVGNGPFPTELLEGDQIGDHLCSVGREYGTTTGRRRRCGWLDIPLLQYSTLLNGYSSINITKLDILNELAEIKIGTKYKIGKRVLDYGEMPSTMGELEQVEVEYETVPGWQSDISLCKTYEELPQTCKDYLKRIEDLVQVPISWIGVGPDRDQMLLKPL